jgi:two-component system sensor histidine kinase KdpD
MVIVLAATASSLTVSMLGVGKESIIMVFLLGVLFTTVLTSHYTWGMLASVASLMLFNFLFTEPRFTFVIYSSNDIVLLLFFLVTAVVSGIVTSRLQLQIGLAAKNERTARILYQIASGFLSVSGRRGIVLQGVSYIREYVGKGAMVKLDKDAEPYTEDGSVLEGLYRDYRISSASGPLGVLRVYLGDVVPDEQTELVIQAVVTQLGIALDREQLYSQRENIRLAMEREHLRANLLRAVSHDLRSPLTALSGAGSLLSDEYDHLTDQERRKLATDISEEIIWLSDLVENILNMTRINESQLVIEKADEVVDDVVSEAVTHVERLLKGRSFTVDLPSEVIMVPMDGRLMVRVLINLLENAVRHTPPEAEIRLEVGVSDGHLVISVADTGNGIDGKIVGSLFDKYVTLDKGMSDNKRGIGLGLSICKAIVNAHGGTIRVEPNQPSGARFVVTLPVEG